MAKKANPRCVRAALSYTIEEAADALNVTVQTVRSWEGKGLKIMKSRRPYLISGAELKAFLESQQQKRRQPLANNQLYCPTCRRATEPYGMMADFIPTSDTSGRLVGLCSICEGVSQRFASPKQLAEFGQEMEIVKRDAATD